MLATSASVVPATGPPRAASLGPNSSAQRAWCDSRAPVKFWASRVRRGKSYGACLDLHRLCVYVPGVPCGLTRLELASMRTSTLVTLQKIAGPKLWAQGWRKGENTLYYPAVRCPDGKVRQSRIVAFGWLDPDRPLSTEYARITIDQAEQIDREHFTTAQTRLNFYDSWIETRCVALGLVPRQLGLVCNPKGRDHFLFESFRPDRGPRIELDEQGNAAFEVILSSADDNAENLPADFVRRLESLKGTIHYRRLVGGEWCDAEGTVYGGIFDPALHLVDAPESWRAWEGQPPPSWPRYRGFDFGVGLHNAFVCMWLARDPLSGVLYRYRELYFTGRTVSDYVGQITALEAGELSALQRATPEGERAPRSLPIEGSWSDHDPNWRGELGKRGIWTQPALKDISTGIQTVTMMLRGRDGVPEILLVRDALVERDPRLVAEKLPTCTEEEFPLYRWPKERSRSEASSERMDQPVDQHNHGLAALRYVLHSLDQARSVRVF